MRRLIVKGGGGFVAIPQRRRHAVAQRRRLPQGDARAAQVFEYCAVGKQCAFLVFQIRGGKIASLRRPARGRHLMALVSKGKAAAAEPVDFTTAHERKTARF